MLANASPSNCCPTETKLPTRGWLYIPNYLGPGGTVNRNEAFFQTAGPYPRHVFSQRAILSQPFAYAGGFLTHMQQDQRYPATAGSGPSLADVPKALSVDRRGGPGHW